MACIQNNANLHTKKIKTLNILDEIPIGESTSLPVFHQYFLALLYTRLKCTSRLYISSRSETYHWVCNQINITGVTSGAGTAYPSGAPEFIPGFLWGSCYSILSFMCMNCRSLFVLFLLAIELSALLRFTDSDYHFGVFSNSLY